MNRMALILIAIVLAVAGAAVLVTSWESEVASPDTAPASVKDESAR